MWLISFFSFAIKAFVGQQGELQPVKFCFTNHKSFLLGDSVQWENVCGKLGSYLKQNPFGSNMLCQAFLHLTATFQVSMFSPAAWFPYSLQERVAQIFYRPDALCIFELVQSIEDN